MALVEKFGANLVTKDGVKDTMEVLKQSKYVILYFSAMWCSSCKMFTKKLEKFYNHANKDEKNVEIVLVSCDEEEEDFNDYYEDHPWIALEFDKERNTQLCHEFDVIQMPAFILINQEGEVVTTKLKDEINTRGIETFDVMKEVFPATFP